MLNYRKMAAGLLALGIATVAAMPLARAQETVFSDAERAGLATCLAKCPDSAPACNNRCISQSQTRGRVWSDDVRACIRSCRVASQAPDAVLSCVAGCRLDRMVQ